MTKIVAGSIRSHWQMAPSQARVTLHNLSNSDGSALYTSPNSTHVLQSAIHYPLEVPYRSDEIPTDTYIEVSLRPHNGVAMVKERYIEGVVKSVLKSVVLGEDTPRSMLQTTIQVMEVEADEDLPGGVKGGGQGEGYLDVLVGAINTSVLGCLDGGVQMNGLIGAVLVGITGSGQLTMSPTVRDRKKCKSLHAFAFNSSGLCVMMESQGNFDIQAWELAETTARSSVCGQKPEGTAMNGDTVMEIDAEGEDNLFSIMRRSVHERIARDERWRL